MDERDSRAWLESQVAEFKRLRPFYESFELLLRSILEKAARLHAPQAVVQTRTKQVWSFAEKCLRKRSEFPTPAHQFTDLCAGRLVVRTMSEVRVVNRYLAEHLEIDAANSYDARGRLRSTEFGYRSSHSVVSWPGAEEAIRQDPATFGFACCLEGCGARGSFHPLKAEVQVRTFAEHAWADIDHDLLYKGSVRLPDHLIREMALLAAELEDFDRTIERVEESLRAYSVSYGQHLSPDRLASEMATLELVLRFDSGNAELAQRLGKLAMTAGQWERAIQVMEAFVNDASPDRAYQPLLRDLGISLAKRRVFPDDLERGRRYLEQARKLNPADSDAVASLAGTWRGEDREEARRLYLEAFRLDPTDYYPLLNYVSLEMARPGSGILAVLGPMAGPAIERCQQHISAGINMPWALYSMARFRLLLGAPYEALEWYALALLASVAAFAARALDDVPGEGIVGFEWARRLLLLGRAVRFRDQEALLGVRALATAGAAPIEGPVVIVAGGTDPRLQGEMGRFRPMLAEALRGFSGTVISGGTSLGVCGLVGELGEVPGSQMHTLGYLPEALPPDVVADTRYGELRRTAGSGFSPLEPLQSWIDLVASGVDLGAVLVIGFNGGMIAAAEYHMALALGARVGVIEESGRQADQLLASDRWAGLANLVPLLADPQTVRAFVTTKTPRFDPDTRERIAENYHRYWQDQRAQEQPRSPAQVDWSDLSEEFKASSRAAADSIFDKLEAIGCEVNRTGGDARPFSPTADELDYLAEMEHGRWCAERQAEGWRWGPVRDDAARLNPLLIPWAALSEKERQADREAVLKLLENLSTWGFRVVRMGVPTAAEPFETPPGTPGGAL